MVIIYVEKEDKELKIKLNNSKKLKDLLKEMNISISSVILVKNNQIVLEDEVVIDSDEIKILSVVSGG